MACPEPAHPRRVAFHLETRGRPAGVPALAAHSSLRRGDLFAPWRLYAADRREHLLYASARPHVYNGDAARECCIAGLGISICPEVDVADELASGSLERVLPDWHGGDAPVVALFPDRATMPKKTRTFVEAIAAMLGPTRHTGVASIPSEPAPSMAVRGSR